MKNEKKSILILCLYITVMLLICAFAVQILKRADNNDDVPDNTEDTEKETVYSTEIIYIPIYAESEASETAETLSIPVNRYTIKSYEGRIGVFSENGNLVRVIEVYTKTLPKADRRMLEEGIVVHGEAELRSIIEDYTG